MSKGDRTCCLCGKKYNYCPTCNVADADKPKYLFVYDSEECRDVWEVLVQHSMEEATSNDVKKVLDKYNITNYDKYGEKIKNQIETILSTVTSEKKVSSKKNIEKVGK